MNCNICGAAEASIHLTEIVNNQMIEIHLCETCANEKGTDFKTHFNFGDLLAGLSDFDKTAKTGKKQEILKCPSCGMTYEEFTKSGRLGCAKCYESLSKMLTPLIKRVQKASQHTGKRPSKIPKESRNTGDLRTLQDRLRKCIQAEEFEQAARLRDEIRQVQEKSKGEKGKSD